MRCLTFFPTKSSKSGILHLEHISVQTSHISSAQEAHGARGPGMGWHIQNVLGSPFPPVSIPTPTEATIILGFLPHPCLALPVLAFHVIVQCTVFCV